MTNLFEQTLGLLTPELSIDFGHDRLRISTQDMTNSVNEASLLILQPTGKTARLYASGNPARSMQGRTGTQFQVERPLYNNQLNDNTHTQTFLTTNIRRALGGRSVFQPRTVVAVPHTMPPTQRSLYQKFLTPTCGKEIYFVPSLLCGAMGIGFNYETPKAQMIIDIGQSSTRIGLISLSSVIAYKESPIGGQYLDRLIVRYFLQRYGIHIDALTAEDIKIASGNALFPDLDAENFCIGRESDGQGTKRVAFLQSDVFHLIEPALFELVEMIKVLCSSVHLNAFTDMMDAEIVLIGGGSQLANLSPFITKHTRFQTRVADFPRESVLLGAQKFHRDQNLLAWASIKTSK